MNRSSARGTLDVMGYGIITVSSIALIIVILAATCQAILPMVAVFCGAAAVSNIVFGNLVLGFASICGDVREIAISMRRANPELYEEPTVPSLEVTGID